MTSASRADRLLELGAGAGPASGPVVLEGHERQGLDQVGAGAELQAGAYKPLPGVA
eukprot:CAMPEP_0118973030 /NCGR_PEP_ID=MMETSP1173-20130426/9156_1 /TAXON_ID=1034831 /ORGANISM="Rhizochromulina marina cf, Strain CCMP1243" /LENGTH=55 /DNA_ID=CAMNT_0006922635 /DNA_START=348 /DNA_END=512 /DNA_ORIENTATION=+